jgi:hypothetical protein
MKHRAAWLLRKVHRAAKPIVAIRPKDVTEEERKQFMELVGSTRNRANCFSKSMARLNSLLRNGLSLRRSSELVGGSVFSRSPMT